MVSLITRYTRSWCILAIALCGAVLVTALSSKNAHAQWAVGDVWVEYTYLNGPQGMVTSPPNGSFSGSRNAELLSDDAAQASSSISAAANVYATVYASASAEIQIRQAFVWQGSTVYSNHIFVTDTSAWSLNSSQGTVGTQVSFGQGSTVFSSVGGNNQGSDFYSSDADYYPTGETFTLIGTVSSESLAYNISDTSVSAFSSGTRGWGALPDAVAP